MNHPHHVCLLLAPGFQLGDFARLMEPLQIARQIGGANIEVRVLSLDGQPVAADTGLLMPVDAAPHCSPPPKLLLICAGARSPLAAIDEWAEWLHTLAHGGCLLAGVGTGALWLARAGLLAGRGIASGSSRCDEFASSLRGAQPSTRPMLLEGSRWSCIGGTHGSRLVERWIARVLGESFSQSVRDYALEGEWRSEQRDQSNYPAVLAQTLKLMEANLEEPLEIRELADVLEVPMRRLQRLFHNYLGCTPSDHYVSLRLQHARELIRSTNQSVTHIGMQCGFTSPSHFSRRYRERFLITPRRDRVQHLGGVAA